MSNSETPQQTGLRVAAALDLLRLGNDEDVRPHAIWALKQVISDVVPEQLSTTAIVSLLSILIPEHSRILSGQGPPAVGRPRTALRLIGRSQAAGS